MFTFSRKYFLLAWILFIVEVLIALFVRDGFVRPYLGDFLVVILIYCAVKSIFNAPVTIAAAGVLLFSYMIEILQYFQVVQKLGWENNVWAKTIIGYGFDWLDMLAYTLGIITVLALERTRRIDRRSGYA